MIRQILILQLEEKEEKVNIYILNTKFLRVFFYFKKNAQINLSNITNYNINFKFKS